MRYMIIPDIHGKQKWKEPATSHLAGGEPVVFLGDYVDGFVISDQQMLDTLADVILLKEQYPEMVTLLLGNHCFPYLSKEWMCSGNRPSVWLPLNALYKDNLHLFQLAHQVGNTLFVHAGLTQGWLDYNKVLINGQLRYNNVLAGGNDPTTIEDFLQEHTFADLLNMLFHSPERKLLWQVSKMHGGWDYYDSPIWVRPTKLLQDCIHDLNQVVGHTHMEQVATEKSLYVENASITFTDTMDHYTWQPLIMEL